MLDCRLSFGLYFVESRSTYKSTPRFLSLKKELGRKAYSGELKQSVSGMFPASYDGAIRIDFRPAGNALQRLHISIFSRQFLRTTPLQIVPFINQQRVPVLNSQAGQFFFSPLSHLLIIQQGFTGLRISAFFAARNNI